MSKLDDIMDTYSSPVPGNSEPGFDGPDNPLSGWDPGSWPSVDEPRHRQGAFAHVLCGECEHTLNDVRLRWIATGWLTDEPDFNHVHRGPLLVPGGPDSTVVVTCGVCRNRVRRELVA